MTATTLPPAPARAPAARGRVRRLLLGAPDDPRWARPALWAVLAVAAALYTWRLTEAGHANAYYSAAVMSGTQSWKAFFFGSLDAGSFITVDKPPMALWAMGLLARVIGVGSWSLLLPQAAAGVAAIAVLYAAVRRPFGHPAALVAASVLALTPITVAINRDNNPDTLLLLFLAGAVWATRRAIETGRLRPLLLAALLVGCGFNTKMLQAFIIVPALALAYLVAARPGLARRALHLLAAGAVLAVSSFWWIAIVDLVPADRRPFIGGSTDGTARDLVLGYNGLGRVFGQGGGPGGGAGFGGAPGAGRLFNDTIGGQISWLLPLAAIFLAAGLALTLRRPRTDATRASLLLWGGSLALHYAVFSFAQGTFHPYYTTAMAPAIAALTGGGAVLLLDASRRSAAWAWILPAGIAVTGWWAVTLLGRTPGWNPWLRWAVAGTAVLAVATLAAARLPRAARPGRPVLRAGLMCALVAALAGPGAYAVSAAATTPNAVNPLAGPSAGGGPGGGRGMPPGMDGSAQGGPPPDGTPSGGTAPDGAAPGGAGTGGAGTDGTAQSGAAPGGTAPGGAGTGGATPGGTAPGGTAPGGAGTGGTAPGGAGTGGAPQDGATQDGAAPGRYPPDGRWFGGRGRGPGGRSAFGGGPGMGGVNARMIDYLERNQGDATWLVAVPSAQEASQIILRTGRAAIAMGGFTGSDPAMTVEKLRRLVADGELRYIVGGGGMGGPAGRGDADVTAWVQENGTLVQPSEYGGTASTSSDSSSAWSGAGLYRLG
ncbi:glycosyltransferase family 39 protein [Actinomadura sp. WAC 06369]|uniref:glycosyltransferase family 39 protein n=1 Tax=Actinomadura sp. WAC 06369 TaxID=2203193 RepID=UPI000F79A4DA|nr:glycosyltransferase family 39 protein [Actinomadura sp. WAC 06369]RSN71770.1 glycosyl transferase family 39 [Actinomadura sp. WAC 06369]